MGLKCIFPESLELVVTSDQLQLEWLELTWGHP